MGEDDLIYLLRRAAKEKTLADAAANHEARAAHRGLAEAYAERARGIAHPPLPAPDRAMLR